MCRAPFWFWLPLCALLANACGKEDAPINRVGVNVVEKSLFQGSWYMSRTVVDVSYDASGLGTFPGDIATDQAGDMSLPRIRWVIDENTLYAFRDYPLVAGGDGDNKAAPPSDATSSSGATTSSTSGTPSSITPPAATQDPSSSTATTAGTTNTSLPVAAYKIEKHFDVRRAYEPSTGEEHNVLEENDTDKPWYARAFMRVDWSKNLLPGYFGQTDDLYELLGEWKREPTDLYVQDASKFPASYRPSFVRMACSGPKDMSCSEQERDFASDYAKDELYHMSFVSQETLSPSQSTDPDSGSIVNACTIKYDPSNSNPTPACTSVVSYVRTSFLKVSDKRQYDPLNYPDTRFDRFGYFRLSSPIDDRSTGSPADPSFGITDFRNYNINRHNLWMKWHDDDGNPIPYAQRDIRKVVWYTTPELPAHLVQSSFDVVGEWNEIFMSMVRRMRNESQPSYPDVTCQKDDPDGYCFCDVDSDSGQVTNPTCVGKYDPFKKPEEYAAGVTDPFDCWVEVPDAAQKMDMNSPALTDADFNPWFGTKFVGSECISILRPNTCNKASQAAQDDKLKMNPNAPALACEDRGDLRYKFLSYVSLPGTGFLGIATLRGDPVSGEIITGDANIGGPALDSYRTSSLQMYDLIQGNVTDLQLEVGEDVRGYFENLGKVSLPARPRSDIDVMSLSLSPTDRAEMDSRMSSVAGKLAKLQGPDGRQQIMSDRRSRLIGTDLEKRLVAGLDAQASSDGSTVDATTSNLTDAQLNQISPLRNPASKRIAALHDRDLRFGMASVEIATEYTDDSVQWFASRHQDWPRSRLEFEINRLLFRETLLHELGHCWGLRHDFGGSADSMHYRDEYYGIVQRYPLPTAASFDTDSKPGLSATESVAYEQANTQARSKRELAGIDGAMNSSIMEYTANFYERLQPLGKYDLAAINFGYGEMVEAYDGPAAGTAPRKMLRYYQGGESCQTDADCPYSTEGPHASDLMDTNMSGGISQHCVQNPNTPSTMLCSSSDDDLTSNAAGGGQLTPLTYRFCSDERADSTLAWCSRFDEGDNYRDIVRNVEESYDRMYVFSAFRRYRADFSANTYADALLSRRLNILQNLYQNLVYQYLNVPEFRTQQGAFGFYDQFLATTDVLNFYARILGQPDVGGYVYNAQTNTYEIAYQEPTAAPADLPVPLGFGRYYYSDYQSGLTGIERLERIGSFFDKARVIELLAERGAQPDYTRDVAFYSNFYDLFPNEMQQIFTGMIRNAPKAYMPRVQCADQSAMPKCTNPQLVYMDFYRGDCSKASTCLPDPADVTYGNMPILDGGASTTLEVYAALYGLSDFPVYFDTTFENQLFVCIEGQASCYQPGPDAKEGTEYVRYTSPRYRRTYLAFQVEPTQSVAAQSSIGFDMVKEARDLETEFEALTKEKNGTQQNAIDNLSQDDLDGLTALGYDPPTNSLDIDSEYTRVDTRLVNLESFLNQLIELQSEYGIIQGVSVSQ